MKVDTTTQSSGLGLSKEAESTEKERRQKEWLKDIGKQLFDNGFTGRHYETDPNPRTPNGVAYIHHGIISVKVSLNEYFIARVNEEKRDFVFEKLGIREYAFWIPESV